MEREIHRRQSAGPKIQQKGLNQEPLALTVGKPQSSGADQLSRLALLAVTMRVALSTGHMELELSFSVG